MKSTLKNDSAFHFSEERDTHFPNNENKIENSEGFSKKKKYAERQKEAAIQKYSEAVSLYANTDMPVRLIAKQCNVSEKGLLAHLQHWHRPLLLARYGITCDERQSEEVKLGEKKGQRYLTQIKYQKAVEACKTVEYIKWSVSAIAREFELNETGLLNQLRMHYPEILEWRKQTKEQMGIAGNTRYGVKQITVEQYASALEMYRSSEKTIPEVAKECNVSAAGFMEYLRFSHRSLLEKKEAEREQAKKRKKRGLLSGNGRLRGPKPETIEKYRTSVELYRNTDMNTAEIVSRTGVTLTGFCSYLRVWHRDLMLKRRGGNSNGEEDWIDLNKRKRCNSVSAGKYAEAIALLKAGKGTIVSVAMQFGFHPDTFRSYLHVHEPVLVRKLIDERKKQKMNRKNKGKDEI